MLARHTTGIIALTLSLSGTVLPAASGDCTAEADWHATFHGDAALDGTVFAVTEFDDGTGPALHAGGEFTSAGGVDVNGIAKWDGHQWLPLGSGVDGQVFGLAVFDDGNGPALYAGGEFTIAGGVAASNIARWDGQTWTPVGGGTNDAIRPMHVFDDGDGPALYVGGNFTSAGGVVAWRVARWDGASWSDLDLGVNGGPVLGMEVFDDGFGPQLYIGGAFWEVGGELMSRLARWDGHAWSDIGVVLSGVRALQAFDDGTGWALYVAGSITSINGVEIAGVARWNGSTWSEVGGGIDGHLFHEVGAMEVFDDGINGEALYMGGSFDTAGGVSASLIARWDGQSWSPLGDGIGATDWWEGVRTMCVFDDGIVGPALYVGGEFVDTPAGDEWLARWGGCPALLADINGDGAVDAADLVQVLGNWGECPMEGACPADLDGDGVVGAGDLAIVLGEWG